MKKSSKHIWMSILAVGAVGAGGVWAYEKYYAATQLSPGAITMATPANSHATFSLPSGSRGWTSATTMANATSAPVSATVPPSAGTHVTVPAAKGSSAALTWTDSTGATQVSLIAFT
jgi:hypothetical protein